MVIPILGLLLMFFEGNGIPQSIPVPPVQKPLILIITPISNNTGNSEYDALAEALSDMLSVSLGEQRDAKVNIKVVERQLLRKVLTEQKLTLMALTDPKNAARVGKLLDADRILIGGILRLKNELVMNLQVYDIESARLITAARAQGKEANLVRIINEVVENLGKGLKLPAKPLKEKNIDKTPKVSLHFMRGLGFYYSGNYDAAIVEFMKARNLDPASQNIPYWTGLSFMKTGQMDHALIEFQNLMHPKKQSPLSPSLRQEIQKLILKCKAATQPTGKSLK